MRPIISIESQIAMALRVLCGFGIEEIAKAFLTNKSTINKRLLRAKEKFRSEEIRLGLPEKKAIGERVNSVLSVLYLLYNEGYYSTTSEKNLRRELCMEAMRLTLLLLENPPTDSPQANALMSLFCFHASRFESRTTANGEQVLYEAQDRTLWDQALIEKGQQYLQKSGRGNLVTEYHLEAAIAFYHTAPEESEDKWEHILQLYNRLLQLKYSPVIALNRTYALYKASGREKAVSEALKIDLKESHLYHLLLAELYKGHDTQQQRNHLKEALKLVTTQHERQTISRKLEETIT